MKYVFMGIIFIQSLFSVQLTPITQTIDSMKKRNITFTVSNTNDRLVAAECTILKLVGHDKDGKEIRQETDDVVVYPSQFVLSVKGKKGVRVNYTKTKLPEKEAVYRVLATQLSLNLKEEKKATKISGSMKFVFSYEGLLFVGGKEGKTDITSSLVKDEGKTYAVTMTNKGFISKFVHVQHFDFILTTDKGEIKLTDKDFGTYGGIRLLPDESFVLHLPKIASLKGQKLLRMSITEKVK